MREYIIREVPANLPKGKVWCVYEKQQDGSEKCLHCSIYATNALRWLIDHFDMFEKEA